MNMNKKYNNNTPILCRKTIEWLNQIFPLQPPVKGWSMEDVWRYAGKREVIDKALTELERQENETIN